MQGMSGMCYEFDDDFVYIPYHQFMYKKAKLSFQHTSVIFPLSALTRLK